MPDDPQPTIFVVEDEPAVRDALAFRLTVAGFGVRAYGAAEPFLADVDPADDGCVVTDLRLPGMDGLQLLEHLGTLGCRLPVIVITGCGDVPAAVRAMQAGAVDFLEKPVAPAALTQVIRRALAIQRDGRALQSEAAVAAARIATLSEREREVFDGLVDGKLGKQIAIDLAISPRTVEVHRSHIVEKLGIRTPADLIRMGMLARLHALGAGGAGKGKP